MANTRSVFTRLSPTVGALLLCVAVATGSKTRFVDDDKIESIAEAVCDRFQGPQTQIGRISTVKKLYVFFENLPETHKLKECRDKNLRALRMLSEVVMFNRDVCNNEVMISLIEKFHQHYISRTKRDKDTQRSYKALEAPKILKYFFYHHVVGIATICKSKLIERLNEATTKVNDQSESSQAAAKVDEFLDSFSRHVEYTSGSTIEDLTLFWNHINRLPLKEDNLYISRYGDQRMALEAKNGASMQTFQRECLTHLKPHYELLALPVLKLIDLGYYQRDEPFASELATRADLRRLLGVTQACEFILPIRVLSNPKLPEGEVGLLPREYITKQGESYGERLGPVVKPEGDHCNGIIESDSVYANNPDEAYQFVKSVGANIKAREKVLSNVLVRMASRLMGKTKSVLGNFFNKHEEREKPTPKILIRRREKYNHEYGLVKKEKILASETVKKLDNYWRRFVAVTEEDDLVSAVIGVPILLILWLTSIMSSVIKGICLALQAVVAPVIEHIGDKVEMSKLLIEKLV